MIRGGGGNIESSRCIRSYIAARIDSVTGPCLVYPEIGVAYCRYARCRSSAYGTSKNAGSRIVVNCYGNSPAGVCRYQVIILIVYTNCYVLTRRAIIIADPGAGRGRGWLVDEREMIRGGGSNRNIVRRVINAYISVRGSDGNVGMRFIRRCYSPRRITRKRVIIPEISATVPVRDSNTCYRIAKGLIPVGKLGVHAGRIFVQIYNGVTGRPETSGIITSRYYV